MSLTLNVTRESDGVVVWNIEELELEGATSTIPIALVEAQGVLLDDQKFTKMNILDKVESRGN